MMRCEMKSPDAVDSVCASKKVDGVTFFNIVYKRCLLAWSLGLRKGPNPQKLTMKIK